MATAEARAGRAARLAREYGVDDAAGHGRYAAVVLCDGRAAFIRDDEIDHLLAHGELVVLIDLDYETDGTDAEHGPRKGRGS